jgi:hypothetical protein
VDDQKPQEPVYATRRKFLFGLWLQSVIVNFIIIFAFVTAINAAVYHETDMILNASEAVVCTTFGLFVGYLMIKRRGADYFMVTRTTLEEGIAVCPRCGRQTSQDVFCEWCSFKFEK